MARCPVDPAAKRCDRGTGVRWMCGENGGRVVGGVWCWWLWLATWFSWLEYHNDHGKELQRLKAAIKLCYGLDVG